MRTGVGGAFRPGEKIREIPAQRGARHARQQHGGGSPFHSDGLCKHDPAPGSDLLPFHAEGGARAPFGYRPDGGADRKDGVLSGSGLLACVSDKRLVQPKVLADGSGRRGAGDRRPVSSAPFRAGEKQHSRRTRRPGHGLQRVRKIHLPEVSGTLRPAGADRPYLSGGKLLRRAVPDLYLHGPAG